MSTPQLASSIVILGGGQAGLAAAYRAARRGLPVTLLEGRDMVGGVGGSFRMDGISVDYGSHRLNTSCAPEVLKDLKQLLRDDLLQQEKNSRLRLRKRWIRMPFHALELAQLPGGFPLAMAGDVLRSLKRSVFSSRHDEKNFQDLLISDLGDTLYRDFYHPYIRKVWGVPVETLSVPKAHQQRNGNFLRNVLHHGLTTVVGRKAQRVAQFYYPRRGFGQISEAYCEAAQKAGARILLKSRVTAVETKNGQVAAVRYESHGGEHRIPAECVWSTLPIPILARCVEPSAPPEVLEAASSLKYRGIILIYLLLEQNQFSEFDTQFIADENIPITRLSEPKNFSRAKTPEGLTVLCLEMPCNPDSAEWRLKDEDFGLFARQCLANAGLAIEVPVRRTIVRRFSVAYPIYQIETSRFLDRIDRWLGTVGGLLTFGLQGLFGHDDSHHILEMAYAAVRCLNDDGSFDEGRWLAFRKIFDARVAEFLRSMNGVSI